MRSFIALNTERVQLGYDDLGNRLDKGGGCQQIVEIALVRPGETVLVVDEKNDLLGEVSELGNGAGRIRVGIPLGECAERCQIRPGRS